MPKPLPGMAAVAEYGDRFAADVASARLHEYGIRNTVLGDPASAIAPHHVTQPGFQVLVLKIELDEALQVLEVGHGFGLGQWSTAEAAALDATYFRREFRDRPRWVQYCTWVTLTAFAGPVALIALVQMYFLIRGLFP